MSNDPAVKVQRELAAEQVMEEFDGKLPDLKLLAFFDDEDWSGCGAPPAQ